jgi:peptidoglycan/xylan/chitin deacetylase (PgdA/CDA1 family)
MSVIKIKTMIFKKHFLVALLILYTAELLAQSVPVFAYHRFGDDRYPSTNISEEVFEEQLKYLEANNYTVLTLRAAYDRIKEGTLPEKAVVLTVDDGYLSFYENAVPLLQKYDMPATLFVNTEYVGGKDFMDWQQLREVSKAGIEIGNHSHAHPHFLNQLHPVKNFHKDTQEAEKLFEKGLGTVPGAYSFPYGEYNRELAEAARKAGFYAATAQRSGVMHAEGNNYAIPRFPMGGPFATLSGFKNKLSMLPLQVDVLSPETTTAIEASCYRFTIETPVAEESVQCFIDGASQELQRDGEKWQVKLPQLNNRRTLLTVTSRGTETGSYHWFSFVLIDTRAEEQ